MSTTGTDRRSVGELLRDVDVAARQLLLDVDGDDAPALLRTWGEVVQNASDLWAAFPREPLASPAAGSTMQRLETMSQSLHRAGLRQNWPGPGAGDQRLLAIADNLARATELVGRHGGEVRPTTNPVRADLAAARMRVMHSLYVGSHAVGVAVGQHQRDLQGRFGTKRPTSTGLGISRKGQQLAARQAAVGRAADRLAAFEQLAGAVVGRRLASVLAGEHRAPPQDGSRLHQALASWDIQAHRTLTTDPTPGNLHLSATTQAGVATAGAAILQAASRTGRLDQDTYRVRLSPALEASQQAWTRLAASWANMVTQNDRTDPDLLHAAGEVRAAIYEVAIDQTGWAGPQIMAGRTDLAAAAATIGQAITACFEGACLHQEVAAREEHLKAPARAMAAQVRDSAQDGQTRSGQSRDVVWVAPRDIHANRPVPLPAPVREQLVRQANQLVETAREAMSASSAIDATTRPTPGPAQEPVRCRREEHQRPAASAMREQLGLPR